MESKGQQTDQPRRVTGTPQTPGTQTVYQIPVPTEYEERAVAFLDIMGWRNLAESSASDPALRAKMGAMLAYLKAMHELPPSIQDWRRQKAEEAGRAFDPDDGRLQFAQFSDSIVISGDAQMFIPLVFNIWGINRALFYNSSLLVRGAVTAGLMYHKGSIAFGPAITAAYDLEQKHAIYPRIIFDPKLSFPENNAVPGSPLSTWFRKSSDGLWFFDYLNPLMSDTPRLHDAAMQPELLEQFIRPSLNHSSALIQEGLIKYSGLPRIWEKYRWMADYFNIVVGEYPTAKIGEIDVKKLWMSPGSVK